MIGSNAKLGLIASLNHPHICTLHDIGHQDGIDYLVMEYLEGETLAQRLLKGSLPLDQVLQYAIEIADALDKAHRKGVTHRDLKPGNIMLTKSGDEAAGFWLGEIAAGGIPGEYLSVASFPQKMAVTEQGTILGTLQYMAPEQLEGQASRCPHRYFRLRRGGLRDGDGQEGFRGQESGKPHRENS